MLLRYEEGELTLEELSLWGVVLRSLDAFDLEGIDRSRKEELWDLIAHISLASVSEAFTSQRVSELLAGVASILEA